MYGEKEVYLHWLLLENKDLDTNTNKGSKYEQKIQNDSSIIGDMPVHFGSSGKGVCAGV